jgi:putative flippase GtrA
LRRWLAFSSVGTLGFAVQFSALLVLTGWFEINYLRATAIAVELAILHNFLWHQRWTWSDRGTMGIRHMFERLVRFNAGTAVTSIGGNLSLMWVLVSLFDVHYAVASVMTVLLLSMVNFLLCDRLVFRRTCHRRYGRSFSSCSGNAARTVVGSIRRENTSMPDATATSRAETKELPLPTSDAPPNRSAA